MVITSEVPVTVQEREAEKAEMIFKTEHEMVGRVRMRSHVIIILGHVIIMRRS